jgi:hypothetical protein
MSIGIVNDCPQRLYFALAGTFGVKTESGPDGSSVSKLVNGASGRFPGRSR